MSIADKLTQVADNHQKVYDAGFAAGQAEGGGGHYDTFWDAYQKNGNRTHYNYAFAGYGWKKETFKPQYSMKPTSAGYMFSLFDGENRDGTSDLVDILASQNVSIDFSQCTNMAYCFYTARISRVGTIDLSSATEVTSVFNSVYLATIENLIPPELEMKNICWQVGLTNLTIGGTITKDMNLSRCSKLTYDSIKSVMTGLSAATTGQTLTLSEEAVLAAFPSDDPDAVNATNQEWADLVATKSNWTITLV